jgi:arylsulfatase A-like enzyme
MHRMRASGSYRLFFVVIVAAVAIAVSTYLVIRSRQPQPIPFRGAIAPSGNDRSALQSTKLVSLDKGVDAEQLRASVAAANVVICIMDAARADHFGAYGYPRETTPNFDRLAKEAVVFDQHFTQYTQTSPSTATLFSGQYPDTHGVAVPRTGNSKEALRPLEPGAFTIDKAMAREGFHTLLFTSTPASAPVLRLGADFQVLYTPAGMVYTKEEDALWRSPEHLLDLIRSTLSRDPRFFTYVHFLPPHNPYEAPEKLRALFRGKPAPRYWETAPAFTHVYDRFHDQDPPATGADWVNLYDAELRWSDWAVGQLVDYLKAIGAYDNTLLIVTADHGEALGEHRYQWHATCPYNETLHIPLLIKFPGSDHPVGRIGALTEIVDIFPTILDLLRVHPPKGALQGKSLVPLLAGRAEELRDYTFTRTNGKWPCYVIRDHRWALLLYQGGTMRALYDLVTDPRQTHNIIAEQPKQAAAMVAAFVRFAKTQTFVPLDFVDRRFKPLAAPVSSGSAMSDETRRKLRSLGYID